MPCHAAPIKPRSEERDFTGLQIPRAPPPHLRDSKRSKASRCLSLGLTVILLLQCSLLRFVTISADRIGAPTLNEVNKCVDEQRKQCVHDDCEQERHVENGVAVDMGREDATEGCSDAACAPIDPLREATAWISPEQFEKESDRRDHDGDKRETRRRARQSLGRRPKRPCGRSC